MITYYQCEEYPFTVYTIEDQTISIFTHSEDNKEYFGFR